MRVPGRELVDPFDPFWETLAAEVEVTVEQIEEGGSAVFGDQGVDVTAPEKPPWASLPDDDLAYHVAHELSHKVLAGRGFPRTSRGTNCVRYLDPHIWGLTLLRHWTWLVCGLGVQKGILHSRSQNRTESQSHG